MAGRCWQRGLGVPSVSPWGSVSPPRRIEGTAGTQKYNAASIQGIKIKNKTSEGFYSSWRPYEWRFVTNPREVARCREPPGVTGALRAPRGAKNHPKIRPWGCTPPGESRTGAFLVSAEREEAGAVFGV